MSVDLPPALRSAPSRLAPGREREAAWELAADLLAAHGPGLGEDPLLTLDGGRVSVHRRTRLSSRLPADAALGPVYRMSPGGGIVVPTGRLLVRYAAGSRFEDHAEQLSNSGYEVDQGLGFAPHAGWVRARSGSIGDGLSDIEVLRGLAGVEHVEPEAVIEMSGRAAGSPG